MAGVEDIVAAYYRKVINEKTRAALAPLSANGRRVSGLALHGYRFGPGGGQVVNLYSKDDLPSLPTSHTLTSPVSWAAVIQISMGVHDDLGNRYTSFCNRTPPPAPTITNINPTSAHVGNAITITGTKFGWRRAPQSRRARSRADDAVRTVPIWLASRPRAPRPWCADDVAGQLFPPALLDR
jgi:hypothetical protein